VVDDTPENIAVLFELLSQQQFELFVAQSGEAAIYSALTEHPDLILLDIMMPDGLDGFNTCQQLKQHQITCEIPIIFMSALSEIEDKVRGFEYGAVDYITKPFHQAEVLARINTHLSLRLLQSELKQQNQQLQEEIEKRKKIAQELAVANQNLQRLVMLDGLTLIANRRRFDEYLQLTWRQMMRDQQPLSLLFCDIDYFKNYNDSYGHQAGDECLKQIAQTLAQAGQRPSDLAARYGGEEFSLILPATELTGAKNVAQRLQNQIAALAIPHQASHVADRVTLSMGLVCQIPCANSNIPQFLRHADQALYQAKTHGRNQLIAKELL
jgi:diguanylate cyclase (GGDEF)-like protein